MTSTLTVDGTGYSTSTRKSNSLLITARGWDLDAGYWLEFLEHTAKPTPKFTGPVTCSCTDPSGTLRFTGDIVSVEPAMGPTGRTWGYRALGLENRANQIPVTGTDGSGVIVYNLPAEDEDYIQANSGQSIGDIVDAVLTSHASELTAAGITTDATTTSQLAALTLVPSEAVYITGERLWQALQAAFQRWHRNGRLVILPSGLVRVVDVTTGSSHTLNAPGQASADPIDPPLWRREWTHCATRVQARGAGRIRPAYVSLLATTLVRTWDDTDEDDWTLADFNTPGDAYDVGAVTTVLGPTSVRINPTDNAKTWATNFWSDRQAWVYLRGSNTGIDYQESAPVTACTALTAGGTSDLTLGLTLDNSGASDYANYELIGKVAAAGDGRNNVWRLYDVTTPGGYVEGHLVKRFPAPVAAVGHNGLSAQLTISPVAWIIKDGISYPASFRIQPATGQILFDRPVVEQLNTPAALAAGGSGVVQPDDIYVLLAYSRGALTATYPPDSGGPVYSGTAYSAAGLERTRTADVPNWIYEGNESLMEDFAEMVHKSISDTLIEGTIRYRGYYSACEDPSGGHTITTVEPIWSGGTTSTTVPVRSCTVRHVYSGGGVLYETELRCTTRRDPRTDSAFYSHLSSFGQGGQWGPVAPAGWAQQLAASVPNAGPAAGMMAAAQAAGGALGTGTSGMAASMGAAAASAVAGMGLPAPSGSASFDGPGRNTYRGKRRPRPRSSPFPQDALAGPSPVVDADAGEAPETAQGGDFYANAPDPADQAQARRRARAQSRRRRRNPPSAPPAPGPPAMPDDPFDDAPQGQDFYG